MFILMFLYRRDNIREQGCKMSESRCVEHYRASVKNLNKREGHSLRSGRDTKTFPLLRESEVLF